MTFKKGNEIGMKYRFQKGTDVGKQYWFKKGEIPICGKRYQKGNVPTNGFQKCNKWWILARMKRFNDIV